MKNPKFTESQIVAILQFKDVGISVNEICREYGIAAPTFYSWKQNYVGMDTQQLREFNALLKVTF